MGEAEKRRRIVGEGIRGKKEKPRKANKIEKSIEVDFPAETPNEGRNDLFVLSP